MIFYGMYSKDVKVRLKLNDHIACKSIYKTMTRYTIMRHVMLLRCMYSNDVKYLTKFAKAYK